MAAFFALAERSSLDMLSALASPPFSARVKLRSFSLMMLDYRNKHALSKLFSTHIDFLVSTHHNSAMSNKKAPTETPISNGAMLTTTEVERTLDTFIMRLRGVELKRRFHDLPQLPYRMPEAW